MSYKQKTNTAFIPIPNKIQFTIYVEVKVDIPSKTNNIYQSYKI